MLPNNSKADSWRKNLKLISHCPVCGRDYKSTAGHRISVVPPQGRNGDARFVHFTCQHCHSHFMAMVMMMPKGMSTVGMVTDLNLKDVQKLYKTLPLTIDETIEGHKMLHSPDFFTKLNLI
jgi:hypothetical protein